MFPSIFRSFVSIWSLLQLLIPLLWARIKAVWHAKAKQTPLNLMILKFVPRTHLWGSKLWLGGGEADRIQFNDQELNSSLFKIDIQLCST